MDERTKSLVEHVRAVHLTLFVLALVLFVASLEAPKAPLKRASDDANAIRRLSEHWDEWNRLYFDRAMKVANTSGTPNFNVRIADPMNNVVDPPSKSILQQVESRHLSNEVLLVGDPEKAYVLTNTHRSVFKTLEDFVDFWDKSRNTVYQLSGIENGSLKCTDSIDRQSVLPDVRITNLTTRLDPRSPGSAAYGSFNGDTYRIKTPNQAVSTALFHFDTIHFDCSVSLWVRRLNIDVRDVSAEIADRKEFWTRAPFDKVFAELSARTTNLRALPIDNIASEMQVRLLSEGERFEAFGAKIPAELVVVLGPLLLGLCQLYLALHVREVNRFVQVSLENVSTGYICLYPGTINWVFTVCSITLPIVVVYVSLWLRVASSGAFKGTSWVVVCATLSCLCAIWQLRLFRKIRIALAAFSNTDQSIQSAHSMVNSEPVQQKCDGS